MESITGHHLYSLQGEDIGEIVDVLGASGPELEPSWLAVKTGWFASRLVPYEVVDVRGDTYVTACAAALVKDAPKVPVHFEPAGEDRDVLCAHYGVASVA